MPSYGYDGPITADVWAKMQQGLAVDYSVIDVNAAKVSANTSGVQVAPGTLGGWGVVDVLAAATQVNLTKPLSGSSWWMICARRNWTTKATTFVAISAGTSRPATLPARQVTPGDIDEQPLALVGWTSTSAQPNSLIDLRVVGMAGQQLIFDSQAMQYLTRAGRQLSLNAVDWECVWSGGTLKWLQLGATAAATAVTPAYTTNPGWTINSVDLAVSGRAVQLYAKFTRAGGTITSPSNGDVVNSLVLNLELQYRPVLATALSSGGNGQVAAFTINPVGNLELQASLPVVAIPNGTILSAGGTWLR